MKTRNSLLKKALDEANISQEKLAEELGVTRAAVSDRLKKDEPVDSIRFIKAVCKLTGRPFTDFVDLTGIMTMIVNEPQEAYGNWKTLMMAAMEAMERELKDKK
jgi:transcriptional regulator with XRE-family HTH domain